MDIIDKKSVKDLHIISMGMRGQNLIWVNEMGNDINFIQNRSDGIE